MIMIGHRQVEPAALFYVSRSKSIPADHLQLATHMLNALKLEINPFRRHQVRANAGRG
jgi:hypothetical protein